MPIESPQPSKQVVIEIGCGSGQADSVESPTSAIGLDVDLRALRGPAGVDTNRRCVCGDALDLPFRTSSCDLLILEAVLHHLVPTDRALEELSRVLRPAGRLHLTDGIALAPAEATALDAELRAAGLPVEPISGFDLEELTVLASEAGLDVVDVQIDGRATFATPPFVSRTYSTKRFTLIAERRVA